MKTTYLKEAQFLLSLSRSIYASTVEEWLEEHPKCPHWIAARIVAGKRRAQIRRAAREAISRADKANTQHLDRDYRPGIGSGRTANCLALGFRHYAVAAQIIHRELGYSGEGVRKIAKAMSNDMQKNFGDLPRCPIDPVYWDNGYTEEFTRGMAASHADGQYGAPALTGEERENSIRWYLFREWHIAKAIGESDAMQLLARLTSDPSARICGYLADSIASWRVGKKGYEGCAGYAHAAWFRDHPEHWDFLISRAPTGAKGDGWEQVFPHERNRASDLRARGWMECLRLNDSIWTPRSCVA